MWRGLLTTWSMRVPWERERENPTGKGLFSLEARSWGGGTHQQGCLTGEKMRPVKVEPGLRGTKSRKKIVV